MRTNRTSCGAETGLFWLVLCLTTAWRIIIAAKLDVCYDEGYYHFWSLSPQLSYLDHPPLTAWAMFLSNFLFGDTVWTVRIWPILAGTAFVLVGRALAGAIFDKTVANRAGIFLAVVPAFAGNGVLMTPDTLFALWWALSLYATWKALQSAEGISRWWLLAGMSTGLGFLSKYNMVLFFFGLGLLWFLFPDHRKRIFIGSIVCGAIAFILFLPVVVWNAQNHWASFAMQLRHGFHSKPSLILKHLSTYMGSLLLVATPLLGMLALWSSVRSIRSKDLGTGFCSVFCLVIAGFFAVSALKAHVEMNWPMLAFFSGVILVAHDWPRYSLTLRRATLGVLTICCGLVAIYPLLPTQFPLAVRGHSFDLKRMREFIGGPEAAAAVQRLKEENGLDFVYVSGHQLLGRISFYAPPLRPFLCPNYSGQIRYPWIDCRKWAGQKALIVSMSESRLSHILGHLCEGFYNEWENLGELA